MREKMIERFKELEEVITDAPDNLPEGWYNDTDEYLEWIEEWGEALELSLDSDWDEVAEAFDVKYQEYKKIKEQMSIAELLFSGCLVSIKRLLSDDSDELDGLKEKVEKLLSTVFGLIDDYEITDIEVKDNEVTKITLSLDHLEDIEHTYFVDFKSNTVKFVSHYMVRWEESLA